VLDGLKSMLKPEGCANLHTLERHLKDRKKYLVASCPLDKRIAASHNYPKENGIISAENRK
jgi:hypothetical protein